MPLSDVQHAHVTKLFTEFCESRVPPHVREKLRLDFRIRGQALERFEVRPRWNAPKEWMEESVAKWG